MRQLTRTRAYWGPFLLGAAASLVVLGMAQTPIVTGSPTDLIWLVLMLALFGAASAVAAGPGHGAWAGALAGLAGLLVADVVGNLAMGFVGTSDLAAFLGVSVLMLGVPYLAGYGLARVAQRSRSSRGATASRA